MSSLKEVIEALHNWGLSAYKSAVATGEKGKKKKRKEKKEKNHLTTWRTFLEQSFL